MDVSRGLATPLVTSYGAPASQQFSYGLQGLLTYLLSAPDPPSSNNNLRDYLVCCKSHESGLPVLMLTPGIVLFLGGKIL